MRSGRSLVIYRAAMLFSGFRGIGRTSGTPYSDSITGKHVLVGKHFESVTEYVHDVELDCRLQFPS